MSKEKPVETEAPKKVPTKRVIATGATYWNFEENPVFCGIYHSEFNRPEDEKEGSGKAGDCIGFNFVDELGETHIISNAYTIERQLNTLDEPTGKILKETGLPIEITFKGKGQTKEGRPINLYEIAIYD